ncbi:MAG: hypothetical protein KF901_32250 [Myxococcales bacterium]|nr:hypothetical protein [Myxococcales bacterium]
MGTLAALVIATPLFGFQLSLDTATLTPSASVPIAGSLLTVAPTPDEEAAGQAGPRAAPTTAELMQQRGRLAKVHRIMGIATWVSMTATVVLGYLQYYNLYGMFSGLDSTPCVEGRAVFGQSSCSRQPLPHLISSMLTTVLYSVTFGLSLRMPDPLNLSEGDSEYAKNLRRHKRLRWVHLAGMAAQILLGVVIANGDRFGMSRANNYGALQALSTLHFALGMMTYVAMTWAGVIFLF